MEGGDLLHSFCHSSGTRGPVISFTFFMEKKILNSFFSFKEEIANT